MFKTTGILARPKLVISLLLAAITVVAATVFVVQANAAHAESVARTTALSESSGFKPEQRAAYAVIAKAQADAAAVDTITMANQVLAQAENKVDATHLQSQVASLAHYSSLDAYTVRTLTASTAEASTVVQAAAAEADRVAAKQAADAAAAAAAEAARIANTPDGARAIARDLAASRYGWGSDQFSCLSQLWQKESGWSVTALNASSGATGIPQALPGSKMATAGADWATNAATQISWGLQYINAGYGTPCAAWSHSQSLNWY